MFGLTLEKLFLVAIIAGLVLGPHRLPVYANQLAQMLRGLRGYVESTRAQAEREMGVSLSHTQWEDLRQYDPRRIVRDALAEPTEPVAPAGDEPSYPAEVLAQAATVRPGQRFLVTGSAAHPTRIPIDSLPGDDPRRVAARTDHSGPAVPG